MAIQVSFSDNADSVLDKASLFLNSEPVRHNLILTLLHARSAAYQPGRYWVATDEGVVVGVVFQSPLSFRAVVTPMPPEVVVSVVEAIVASNVKLPGVVGDVATAACFAGQWAERQKSPAIPFIGHRLYEVDKVSEPSSVNGFLRKAVPADTERLIGWVRHFQTYVGEPESDAENIVDERMSAGRLWLWDNDGAVSMVSCTPPVQGVVRVQLVYTPPAQRKRGYASASVAGLSKQIRDAGNRCILYTDLGNPISNSVYQQIGYAAVAEGIQYRFE